MASDSSRVHNGDSYNTQIVYYHSYTTSDDSYPTAAKRKRSVSDSGDAPELRDHHALEKVLAKLADCSTSIGHHKQDDAASKLARRICVVLDALKHSGNATGTGHAADELEKLKYRAILARQVGINNSAQIMATKLHAKAIELSRRNDTVEFGRWTITLTTRTVKYRDEGGIEYIESLARLHLEAFGSSRTSVAPVSILFGERTDYRESRFIPPTIVAYRRVSIDSEVFHLVSDDDIDGFRELLSTQRATMRDCDMQDRSLLHVSTCEYAPQPGLADHQRLPVRAQV